MGLTITNAAKALGVTRETLSELVNGKRVISPEMAVRLAKVFGGSEQGWLVQQAQYDLAHVRRDRIKLKRLALARIQGWASRLRIGRPSGASESRRQFRRKSRHLRARRGLSGDVPHDLG